MKETRRKNLQAFIDGPRFNGRRDDFCASAGITKSRLSQLLKPGAAFGDNSARHLTDNLGLPANFFDKTEYVMTGKTGTYQTNQGFDMELAIQQIGSFLSTLDEPDRKMALRDLEDLAINPAAHEKIGRRISALSPSPDSKKNVA